MNKTVTTTAALGIWLFLHSCAPATSDSKPAEPAAPASHATAASAVIVVTEATFAEQVLAARQPVIVQFHAGWCSHCRAVGDDLGSLRTEHAGSVKVVSVDIDAQAALAARYGIESVPTLSVFMRGKVVGTVVGQRDRSVFASIFESLSGAVPAQVESVLRALEPAADGSACDTRLAESESGDGTTCAAPTS